MKRTFLATALGLLLAAQVAVAAPKKQLQEIRPDNAFLAAVSPITTKMKDVRFFEAGSNLIGVVGRNPVASGKRDDTLIMFFDKSGEYLVVGQVMEWRENHNVSSTAVAQFRPDSELAKLGAIAQQDQDDIAAKYKVAVDKDIATQRADMQKRNEDATKRVEAVLANGVPSIDIGRGPKEIVAFVDLTCQHCVRAIKDLVAFAEGQGASTHKIRLVLTANPRNSQNSNATAMIYGSQSPLAALKAELATAAKFNAALVQAGTTRLTQVQTAMKTMQVRTVPFFVLRGAGKARTQTGYGNLQDLTR